MIGVCTAFTIHASYSQVTLTEALGLPCAAKCWVADISVKPASPTNETARVCVKTTNLLFLVGARVSYKTHTDNGSSCLTRVGSRWKTELAGIVIIANTDPHNTVIPNNLVASMAGRGTIRINAVAVTLVRVVAKASLAAIIRFVPNAEVYVISCNVSQLGCHT